VWLDGPRRTAPDGSSFALQHWTHDFHFSLVSGPGDWRRAGFVRHGQEVNHPLLPLPTEPHEGVLPPRLSLLTVEPENVLLSAFKPRGNPLASGQPGETDPATGGVVFRLYESQGRPATAVCRLYGGLAEAEATDLLEQRSGAVPTAEGDGIRVELGAADIVTVAARPLPGATRRPEGEPVREPAQPVFTRYWLHNTGPAPVGNLPTSVHLTASGDAGDRWRITVAASARPAHGTVELDVPPGLTAHPDGPLDYDLAPGEYGEFGLTVGADGAAAPGTYYVAARIRDELGQTLEDVLPFTVGADDSGLEAHLTYRQPGELVVRLINHDRSAARGEAQLLSPYGTWGSPGDDVAVTPRTRGFDIPPGATVELPYTVAGTPQPGARYWALAKISSFGRVQYTDPVPIAGLDGQATEDSTAEGSTPVSGGRA
jgi:hypothetical protein